MDISQLDSVLMAAVSTLFLILRARDISVIGELRREISRLNLQIESLDKKVVVLTKEIHEYQKREINYQNIIKERSQK